ncbi:MAG TPA: DUF2723 domain-containing protein [candidate division Zixibacteria bacterium]|nr:DUF2723 domain-containing protein [candidate division Zixibacteria bacterium]
MERLLRAIGQFIDRWGWVGPPAILGLYAGRVLSELVQLGLVGAVAITLVTIFLSIFLLRRNSLERTWPLLFLVLYVPYPDADFRAALSVAVLSFIIGLLNYLSRRSLPPNLNRRRPLVGAIIIGVGFFLLYLITLSPGLLPADSGEFQLVAATLGVAHPPGFPLYTMLANLMTRLPLGLTPATMTNIFSVITGTLTLLLVYGTVFRLTRSTIGGLVAAGALGTATTFWAQSTTTNIRSLTAFFAALAIYLLVRYREERQKDEKQTEPAPIEQDDDRGIMSSPFWKYAVAIVLVMVLGITHHTSLIFLGMVFIIFLFWTDRKWISDRRLWPWLILAVVVGLIPLLYLPLRSAAGAQGAPEDLTTIKGFFNHILALGFRGDFFYFTEPAILWERLKVMANIMTFQFDGLILITMLLGFLLLLRRDRKLAFLFGGSIATMVLVTAMYRAPQSVEYLMPAYIPLAILAGYAVGMVHKNIGADGEGGASPTRTKVLLSILLGFVILAVISQGVDRLPSFTYLHENNRTRDDMERLLAEAPDDSMILADWHWVTPLWYLQEVEGLSTDIEIDFVYPTGEEYGQTWARRIQEELNAGHPVLATHFDQDAYTSLPPSDPIDDAFLFGSEPRRQIPDGFLPLDISFNESIQVEGYSVERHAVEVGQESILILAWRPLDSYKDGLSLFTHLVGEDGKIYAQQDLSAKAKEVGLNFAQFRLTPRPATGPGEYGLMVGAYGEEPLANDLGEIRTRIGSLDVIPAAVPVVTNNPSNKTIAGSNDNRILVGYDWDNTFPDRPRLYLHWQTPEGYYSETIDTVEGEFSLENVVGPWGVENSGSNLVNYGAQQYIPFGQGIVWSGKPFQDVNPEPGQNLPLTQLFSSAYPIDHDLVVSLRLVGFEEDGFHWAWWDLDDGIPAMGAIPTLKWIGGSNVRDPHWLTADDSSWPGQEVSPLLRLYDAFTGRDLPILDERISEETPWLPLGSSTVAEQPD